MGGGIKIKLFVKRGEIDMSDVSMLERRVVLE